MKPSFIWTTNPTQGKSQGPEQGFQVQPNGVRRLSEALACEYHWHLAYADALVMGDAREVSLPERSEVSRPLEYRVAHLDPVEGLSR